MNNEVKDLHGLIKKIFPIHVAHKRLATELSMLLSCKSKLVLEFTSGDKNKTSLAL